MDEISIHNSSWDVHFYGFLPKGPGTIKVLIDNQRSCGELYLPK